MAKRQNRKRRFRFPTGKQWREMVLGSDRPGHLFAAVVVGCFLIVLAVHLELPWLNGLGQTVMFWEWACTPDVDVAERRSLSKAWKKGGPLWFLICLMWWPYGAITPHRSAFSHSLVLGLPCRFGYVVLTLFGISLLGWSTPYDWAWGNAWQLWNQQGLLPATALFLSRWGQFLSAAAIADAVHMLKDEFTVEEIIWGKD